MVKIQVRGKARRLRLGVTRIRVCSVRRCSASSYSAGDERGKSGTAALSAVDLHSLHLIHLLGYEAKSRSCSCCSAARVLLAPHPPTAFAPLPATWPPAPTHAPSQQPPPPHPSACSTVPTAESAAAALRLTLPPVASACHPCPPVVSACHPCDLTCHPRLLHPPLLPHPSACGTTQKAAPAAAAVLLGCCWASPGRAACRAAMPAHEGAAAFHRLLGLQGRACGRCRWQAGCCRQGP